MTRNTVFKSEEGRNKILSFYEDILKSWHQPSEQYFVETVLGDTFIIESGNKKAPAVVLLHGTGFNSAMWLEDARRLSQTHRVLAIDIVGECGKSDENRPAFKGTNYSDWLLEIFEKVQIKYAVLIGCSLGGWIATDFTIAHPDKTDKLILQATAGITQVRIKTIFLIMLTSVLGEWGFNKINRMVYETNKIETAVLEFAGLVKEYFKPRTDVLPLFSDEQLQKIKASVLFIGGDNDCFYNSQKSAERLSQHVANCTTVVLQDTGHVVLDQTKRFIDFINDNKF